MDGNPFLVPSLELTAKARENRHSQPSILRGNILVLWSVGISFLMEKGWKRGLVQKYRDGFECDITGSACRNIEVVVSKFSKLPLGSEMMQFDS